MRRALTGAAGGTAVLAVPLVLVAVWATTVASPSNERVAINFLLTLILVLGLQAFSGNSGIVSFGHVGFMGVGAYLAAFLTIPTAVKSFSLPGLPSVLVNAELGLVPSVVIAALVTAVVAAVVGLALTRMQEGAMTMATIALLVMFFVVANAADGWTRGASGVYSIPQTVNAWTALVVLLGVAFVVRLYRDSDRGLELRASREDPLAAGALGTDVKRRRLGAWVLSGLVMGVGGALFAEYNLAFDPSSFYFDETFSLLAILIIGGPATITGAVLGAAIVTVATQFLQHVENGHGIGPLHLGSVPGLTEILIAVLILVILRVRPDGLVSRAEVDERLRGRLRRAPAPTEGG